MTQDISAHNPTAEDRLHLALALRQSCSTLGRDPRGWMDPTTEALRCLRLLYDAMAAMPPAHEGPVQQHINWAYVTRLRAEHALTALPQDRTAPTRPIKARVAFGQSYRHTGDNLVDTFLLDQSWLIALRDDFEGALHNLGCEDARTTADTVRDLIRCLTTYLTEAEMGQAAGGLGFTCDADQPGLF